MSSDLVIQEYQDENERYNFPKSSEPILIRQPFVAFSSPSSICLGITPPVLLRFGILNNEEQGGSLDSNEESDSKSNDRLSNVYKTQFHSNASLNERLSKAGNTHPFAEEKNPQPPAAKENGYCFDLIPSDHEINAYFAFQTLSNRLSSYLLSQSRNNVQITKTACNDQKKIFTLQPRPKELDDILSLIEEDSFFINHTKFDVPLFGILAMRKETFDSCCTAAYAKQVSSELFFTRNPMGIYEFKTRSLIFQKHKDDFYPRRIFYRTFLVVPDSLCPPNTLLMNDIYLNEKLQGRNYALGHANPRLEVALVCLSYKKGIIRMLDVVFHGGYMGEHAENFKKLYLGGVLRDNDWYPLLELAMSAKIEKFRPFCVFLLHYIFSPLIKERGFHNHPLLVGSPSFKTVSFDLLIEMSAIYNNQGKDIQSLSKIDLMKLNRLYLYIEHNDKFMYDLVEEKSKEPFVHPAYNEMYRYMPNFNLHYVQRFINFFEVTSLPLLAETLQWTNISGFEKNKKAILLILDRLRKVHGDQVVLELAQKMFKSKYIRPHCKPLIVSEFGTLIDYHGVKNGIKSNEVCDFMIHCYVHKVNLHIYDFIDTYNIKIPEKADFEKAFCLSIGHWQLRRPDYSPFNLVPFQVYFLNHSKRRENSTFDFPLDYNFARDIILYSILSNSADSSTFLELFLEWFYRLEFMEEEQMFKVFLHAKSHASSRSWVIRNISEKLNTISRPRKYYNELIFFKYAILLCINVDVERRNYYSFDYLFKLSGRIYSSTDEEIVNLVEENRSYDFEIDLSYWLSLAKSNMNYNLSDYDLLVSGLAYLNFGIPFRYTRIKGDIYEAPDLNGIAFHLEFIITRYATLIKPDIKKMFSIRFIEKK